MSITIGLEMETENWLVEQARREGREPAQVAADLLQSRAQNGSDFSTETRDKSNADAAYEAALAAMKNRTPEQIAEARARLFARSRQAKPLQLEKRWKMWFTESGSERKRTTK